MDELNRELDARARCDERESLGADGPDYIVIRREIPPTKGKWRMVSKEVEDAGRSARPRSVPVIRFHDLGHPIRDAPRGVRWPLRALQEFLGHPDLKTTQIYAHDARSAWEL